MLQPTNPYVGLPQLILIYANLYNVKYTYIKKITTNPFECDILAEIDFKGLGQGSQVVEVRAK